MLLFVLFVPIDSEGRLQRREAMGLSEVSYLRSPPPLPDSLCSQAVAKLRGSKGAVFLSYARGYHQTNNFAVGFPECGRNDMCVDIHGRTNICVTQKFLLHLEVDTKCVQEARVKQIWRVMQASLSVPRRAPKLARKLAARAVGSACSDGLGERVCNRRE